MKCCEDYLNLGCFNNCDDIYLGIFASEDGVHTIEFSYGNSETIHNVNIDLNISEEFYIPMPINENNIVYFKIKQPSGSYYEIAPYICFSINTNVIHNHTIENCGCGAKITITENISLSYNTYKVFEIDVTCNYPIYGYKITYNDKEVITNSNIFAIDFVETGNYVLAIIPIQYDCTPNVFTFNITI